MDAPRVIDRVLEVTTRHARCVLFMRGALIIEARRRPVLHRGAWVKVID